jgi:hypothetical protein
VKDNLSPFEPGDVIVKRRANGKVAGRYTVDDPAYTPKGKLRYRRESGTTDTAWWPSPAKLPPTYELESRSSDAEEESPAVNTTYRTLDEQNELAEQAAAAARLRDTAMPQRIAALDTHRGFPVPWFVDRTIDPPDFRIIDERKVMLAADRRLCWVCGQALGAYAAYVVGPMCCINRVSAEPPSHRECAEYSARVCPFLSRPHARRRTNAMPDGLAAPAGMMIERNPGVTLMWVTKKTIKRRGVRLFDIGEPTDYRWFCRGRDATREEVMESIQTGLPILQEAAEAEGPHAVRQLQKQYDEAMSFVPHGTTEVPA